MNAHLNLFVPYSQGGDNPVENNLSRGLAILLNENPLLFDRFLDLINGELHRAGEKAVAKPASPEERSIDIQMSASKLADLGMGIQRIVPVTLTPAKTETEDGTNDTQNPIPDIIVFCGGDETSDLILVEVKQYATDATAQVLNQATTIRDNLQAKLKNAEISITESAVRLTWEEVIQSLQEIETLQSAHGDFVLNQYLDYLKEYRQGWFPVEPFSAGMSEQMMWKRVWPLAQNCARLLADSKDEQIVVEDSGWSCKFPLTPSWDYIREVHLYPYNDEDRIEGLGVGLWLGNNSGQSWALFAGDKTRDNMLWVRNTAIDTLSMEVKPFLKFAHIMGRHVMGAYLAYDDDITELDKKSIRKKYYDSLNGRWKRDEWDELKKRLLNVYPGLLADAKGFEEEFREKVEKSGRGFVDVSLGFEIEIRLPIEKLEALDKSGNKFMDAPEHDAVARLIADELRKLRKMIEK